MSRKRVSLFSFLLVLLSMASAQADTAVPASVWAGSTAQLGVVINTGNTNSLNISYGTHIQYQKNAWQNTLELDAAVNRSLGVTTKQRYALAEQLQYSLKSSINNFLYANLSVVDDRFSPYEYQMQGSLGYGRNLMRRNRLVWTAQLGPGMRYDNIKGTDKNSTSATLYMASKIDWTLSDNINVVFSLKYTVGQLYNFINSMLALNNKITGHLALQASYSIQNYSKLPPASAQSKKTDTISNLALVYNF